MTATRQPRTRGRPRKGEELAPDMLLDAALAAFSEHGFENASLRAIASAAGMDVKLIMYRYESKLGLWKSVIEAFSSETAMSLTRIEAEVPNGAMTGRLRAILQQLTDVVCQKPQFAYLILSEISGSEQSERLEFIYKRLISPIQRLVLPVLAAAQGKTANDPDHATNFLFFTILGTISATVATRSFVSQHVSGMDDERRFRHELAECLLKIVVGRICEQNEHPSRIR